MVSSVEFKVIHIKKEQQRNRILLETTFCSLSVGNHNIKEVCPKSKQEITSGETLFSCLRSEMRGYNI